MPRGVGDVYAKTVTFVDNTTAEAADMNGLIDDIVTDLNTARPVTMGGTGSTTASGARTNLGLGTMATQAASSVDIGGGEIDGTIIGANSASSASFTQVNVDNITLDVNTISTTDTNGDLVLAPDGSGAVRTANLLRVDRTTSSSAHFANSSGTSSTVLLSLDPGDQGIGAYDAQVQSTNDGSNNTELSFWTANAGSPSKRLTVEPNGKITNGATYNNTTGNAANMYVDSGGQFYRSTSTLAAKVSVEPADKALLKQAIKGAKSIWYRSNLENDNSNWSWWGFGAEQIAEIDPRFVQYKTHEIREKPVKIKNEKDEEVTVYDTEVVALDTPVPDGVAYERFVVAHNSLLNEHDDEIEELKAQVSDLKAQVASLLK